jgi:hypothetical protein
MVNSSTIYKVAFGAAGADWLESLPFAATFSQQTMVPGQSVAVASGSIPYGGTDTDTEATTLTLLPQTFNGKIGSIATAGSYTTYTVNLAPYDLVSTLSAISEIVVYVDSSTRMLNTSALTAGSLVRVHGLLFNDAGTRRLACDQIMDGVAE